MVSVDPGDARLEPCELSDIQDSLGFRGLTGFIGFMVGFRVYSVYMGFRGLGVWGFRV